jgi:hypothetical protein
MHRKFDAARVQVNVEVVMGKFEFKFFKIGNEINTVQFIIKFVTNWPNK